MNESIPPFNPVEFAKALADEAHQKIMELCCRQWCSVTEIVVSVNFSR